jgi:death-on-curing protein
VREYLTLVEVLATHSDQIERYGGSPGLRDPGALEAALFRPQSGYYADLIEEASALWESLAQNHPFIDRHKRVSFAATYTFLFINGTRITADAGKTFSFIDGLYQSGSFEFRGLADWLRANSTSPP